VPLDLLLKEARNPSGNSICIYCTSHCISQTRLQLKPVCLHLAPAAGGVSISASASASERHL
jgi:hypothetical protein